VNCGSNTGSFSLFLLTTHRPLPVAQYTTTMPARRQIPPYQRRAEKETLRFNKNGTFKISVFSDLHFAEGMMTDKSKPSPNSDKHYR